VTVAVDAGASDAAFATVADLTVDVTTTDDDTPTFTVTPTNGTTVVDENGSMDTLLVALGAVPTGTVVITVSSDDTGEATVLPVELTFNAGNWSDAQAVIVTGGDDAPLTDGPQDTQITFSIDDAKTDDLWDDVADVNRTATTTDTDTPGFTTRDIHRKLSLRASITSELILQDVRLPHSAALPGVTGMRGPLSCLSEARYGICWGAVGAGSACYLALLFLGR